MNRLETIYAGILGKAIGVRLGAPIEPTQWSYEIILESFGDIRGYVKDSRLFAADDDTNGPIFFIRALLDYPNLPLTESVSRTWLNYASYLRGMFWWGGDQVSTEHTSFNNLMKGYVAPQSGSTKLNGSVMANQVGGQIFVDSWGLIALGEIDRAMQMAYQAASVAHDDNGLEGAAFIAGCIAGAYNIKNTHELVVTTLEKLNHDKEYYQVAMKVVRFYADNPSDFRACYEYVRNNHGYDHYEGACHIIPNMAIVLIGLLYSDNDFSRAIEISCMCGWDTDSNAGVVGTIMGVMNGLDNIPWHYRDAINDRIVASSMSPSLNSVDLVDFARLLETLSTRDKRPELLTSNLNFDFPFTGSSHGLQIENDFRLLRDKVSRNRKPYCVFIDNLIKGDTAAIYLKTMTRVSDLPDQRYEPVFAPLVYPGQTFAIDYEVETIFNDALEVALYVGYQDHTEQLLTEYTSLKQGTLRVELPTSSKNIERIGLRVKTESTDIDGNGVIARLLIRSLRVFGKADYSLDFSEQEAGFSGNVTPFSNHRISTELHVDRLKIVADNSLGLTLIGQYYARYVQMKAKIEIVDDGIITLPFRIKGLEDYEYFEIGNNTLALKHRDFMKETTVHDFGEINPANQFDVTLIVDQGVRLIINDQVFEFEHCCNEYGHFGFGGRNVSYLVSDIRIESESL